MKRKLKRRKHSTRKFNKTAKRKEKAEKIYITVDDW